MKSFGWAAEIVLKETEVKDAPRYKPESEVWKYAVQQCGSFSLAALPADSSSLLTGTISQPLDFPILTPVERKLTPALGYVF